MRIKLYFISKEKNIPLDYHPCIMSFFKAALSKYDKQLYESFYGTKTPVQKSFTFSTYLPDPTFSNDEIILGNEIIVVTVSTPDMILGIDLYNALLSMKNISYPFGKNAIKLIDIKVENHKLIKSSSVYIKLLSPIIVKAHVKDKHDEYYTAGDECFDKQLKLICAWQFKNFAPQFLNKKIEFESINCKKTVVSLFGQKIAASIGIMKLTSDSEIINYLYQAGIGSKRSSGFGNFEIIREEGLDEYQ